jgi:hypothetical protein
MQYRLTLWPFNSLVKPMIKRTILLLALLAVLIPAMGQSPVVNQRQIGWLCFYGDYTTQKNFIFSLDAQLRYEYTDGDWFQQLWRSGVTYKTAKGYLPTAGLAFFSLYPNPNGLDPRPEFRPWQEFGKRFSFKSKKHTFYPRLRFEQRFIKEYAGAELADKYSFNSFRLRLRCDYTLKFTPDVTAGFYLTASDEIFFYQKTSGFSAFDQNRIWLGLGYRFDSNISVQIVYMNLYLQRNSNLYEMHHTPRITFIFQLKQSVKSSEQK